jgi:hypothetical protein
VAVVVEVQAEDLIVHLETIVPDMEVLDMGGLRMDFLETRRGGDQDEGSILGGQVRMISGSRDALSRTNGD